MPTQTWSSSIGAAWPLAPGDAGLSPVAASDQSTRQAWQRLIDQLTQWRRDPSQLADEGVDAPSAEIIDKAILVAERSQQRGLPAPSSVVSDANGGIVLERREGSVAEVLHLWDDGTVEYQRFQGTALVERRPL